MLPSDSLGLWLDLQEEKDAAARTELGESGVGNPTGECARTADAQNSLKKAKKSQGFLLGFSITTLRREAEGLNEEVVTEFHKLAGEKTVLFWGVTHTSRTV
jgi:hypothetical protein